MIIVKTTLLSALLLLASCEMDSGGITGHGTGETHSHSHDHSAASPSTDCRLSVVLSEEAEKRAGGALHRVSSSKQDEHHGHSDDENNLQTGQNGDSTAMHSIHETQFGGRSFFMAPNRMHHLEPLYSAKCGFRLLIYNAYTQPISTTRFRSFIKIIPEDQNQPEMIRFLTPSADETLLVAATTPHLQPPFEIELYVKFPEADEPELFNIDISTL